MRSQELKALGEAINILTGDEAHDLFGKTLSFLQTGNVGAQKGANVQRGKADAARNQAVMSAMKKILRAAHRHQNWALATLAVRVRLDPFTKVHEAMDKMLADLKEQQKAEVKKMDYCKTEIDTTEDAIKTKSSRRRRSRRWTTARPRLTRPRMPSRPRARRRRTWRVRSSASRTRSPPWRPRSRN